MHGERLVGSLEAFKAALGKEGVENRLLLHLELHILRFLLQEWVNFLQALYLHSLIHLRTLPPPPHLFLLHLVRPFRLTVLLLPFFFLILAPHILACIPKTSLHLFKNPANNVLQFLIKWPFGPEPLCQYLLIDLEMHAIDGLFDLLTSEPEL
jgi:hypothetical protein